MCLSHESMIKLLKMLLFSLADRNTLKHMNISVKESVAEKEPTDTSARINSTGDATPRLFIKTDRGRLYFLRKVQCSAKCCIFSIGLCSFLCSHVLEQQQSQ